MQNKRQKTPEDELLARPSKLQTTIKQEPSVLLLRSNVMRCSDTTATRNLFIFFYGYNIRIFLDKSARVVGVYLDVSCYIHLGNDVVSFGMQKTR